MYDIQLNDNLLRLVENKRVIILGPAPYLIGSGAAKEIDDYDVVCRVNDIIPPLSLRPDYGNRTDIMFHNFGRNRMPGLKKKIETYSKDFQKLKMISCLAIKTIGNQPDYLQWPNDYVSEVVKNFESVNEYNVPFYWIGVEDYKKLHKVITVEANQGTLAMGVLAQYPLKELAIKGCNFYMEGHDYDKVYFKGYIDDHTGIGHEMDPQIAFLKRLLTEKQNIVIDSHLQKLFNEHQ
jgi:hypothetical protein